MRAGVVAEIVVDVGRAADKRIAFGIQKVRINKPWDTIEEETAAIRLRDKRYKIVASDVGSGTNCRLVGVMPGAIAREDVSALVADIGNLNVHRRRQLALHSCIPRIQGRQALHGRANTRRNVVLRPAQRKDTVCRNGDWHERRGSLSQSEHGAAVIGKGRLARQARISHVLVRENRQVLGHHVTEVRTKHADIEAATVTDTDDSLRIYLVSHTDTRGKRLQRIIRISVVTIIPDTGHTNDALFYVCEPAFASTIDGFGEINLPP